MRYELRPSRIGGEQLRQPLTNSGGRPSPQRRANCSERPVRTGRRGRSLGRSRRRPRRRSAGGGRSPRRAGRRAGRRSGRHGDVGDVVDVDERLGDVAGRERQPPRSTESTKKPSLKFWAKKLERTIVHAAPESCTACSPRSAPSSFRPDRSTSRRAPHGHGRRGEGADRVGGAREGRGPGGR